MLYKNSIKIVPLICMFAAGAVMGVLSKLLDIYTTNLANIFSEMSVWILFGVLISVYSPTKAKAALNVFLFCIGMLAAYYITAEMTGSVYGKSLVIGWSVFSLFSPLFAYFTRMTKEEGAVPKIISVGIILTTLFASVILFEGPRVYDVIIIVALIWLLFIKKVKPDKADESSRGDDRNV